MAFIVETLGALDDATEWINLERGPCDVGAGSGLTGTLVLEYRIKDGSAKQMYDKDGTAYSWTGAFNANIEVGGSSQIDYRLRCSAYTSGSSEAYLGHE